MKKWNNPCLENLNLSSTKKQNKPEGCISNKARPGGKCPNPQGGARPTCGYFRQDDSGNEESSSAWCDAPADGEGGGSFDDTIIPGISG